MMVFCESGLVFFLTVNNSDRFICKAFAISTAFSNVVACPLQMPEMVVRGIPVQVARAACVSFLLRSRALKSCAGIAVAGCTRTSPRFNCL